MGDAGTLVLINDGYPGVRSDGTLSLFNEDEQCIECCAYTRIGWVLEDQGLITDGQQGAARVYTEETLPPHPLWEITHSGTGVKATFEPDWQCYHYNEAYQSGTATGNFILTEARTVRIDVYCQHKCILGTWHNANAGLRLFWAGHPTHLTAWIDRRCTVYASDACNAPWYGTTWVGYDSGGGSVGAPPYFLELLPGTYGMEFTAWVSNLHLLRNCQASWTVL